MQKVLVEGRASNFLVNLLKDYCERFPAISGVTISARLGVGYLIPLIESY